MNFKSLIWSIKFYILKQLAKILEKLHVSSVSAGRMGTYDGEEFIFIDRWIRSNPLNKISVMDIGANNGDWALKFLSLADVPGLNQCTLLCIEPIPAFYELLKLRTESHRNVICANIAIVEIGNEVKIAEIGGGGSAFVPAFPSRHKSVIWHDVSSMRGDDLLVKYNIQPDYIKIDTDGFDFSVIKSLSGYLASAKPLIQFEFTYRFAQIAGYKLKDVIEFLNSLQYQVFVLDKDSNLKRVLIPRLEVINHQTKNFIAIPELNDFSKSLLYGTVKDSK
jgi:FkbM family methyltransferase